MGQDFLLKESYYSFKMNKQEIIAILPYSKPFLFVDEILSITENGVEGSYTFDSDLDFYKGHFKDNPITPGVILTEVMAQIGLVCLGIFLLMSSHLHQTSCDTLLALSTYVNSPFKSKGVVEAAATPALTDLNNLKHVISYLLYHIYYVIWKNILYTILCQF